MSVIRLKEVSLFKALDHSKVVVSHLRKEHPKLANEMDVSTMKIIRNRLIKGRPSLITLKLKKARYN